MSGQQRHRSRRLTIAAFTGLAAGAVAASALVSGGASAGGGPNGYVYTPPTHAKPSVPHQGGTSPYDVAPHQGGTLPHDVAPGPSPKKIPHQGGTSPYDIAPH